MTKRALTGEEALAILTKQREYQREYQQKPEVIAKRREYQQKPEVIAKRREYQRKVAAGYAAAKKAGLI